jgi:adenosylmethionine-8-amino-7-oxononanoate aminotransferase
MPMARKYIDGLAGLWNVVLGHGRRELAEAARLMCAIEFVKDRGTKAPFAPDEQVGARIDAESVSRGLFSRVRGDVFVLAPPFVIPDDQLDRIAEILAAATKAVLG